jgi:hypothetical protein
MSNTLIEQLLTATYIGAYQKTYDQARREGIGPTEAGYLATRAADAARVQREQTEAGNAARRRAAP